MKKIMTLVALLLCICTCTCAFAAGSKTVKDTITVTTYNEAGEKVNVLYVKKSAAAAVRDTIKAVAAAESLNDYFGVDLSEKLGAENVAVYELFAIQGMKYDSSMGAIDVNVKFATPYAANENVVVLLGINTEAPEWTVLEGTSDEKGVITFKIPAEMFESVQSAGALVAVASKAAE